MSFPVRQTPSPVARIVPALSLLLVLAHQRDVWAQPPHPTDSRAATGQSGDEAAPAKPSPEELPAAERTPGWLGVLLQDGFAPLGVLVVDVAPQSPAARAGLRPGDLIRRIADAIPRDALDVTRLVGQREAGAAITLTVDRAGAIIDVSATLAAAPKADAAGSQSPQPPGAAPWARPLPPSPHRATPPPRAWLGVETAPVTNLARRVFFLPNNQGVVVSYVYANSPALRAGIRPGAVIRAIDSRPVTNPYDVERIVAEAGPGSWVEVALWVDNQPISLDVRLSQYPQPQAVMPLGAPSPAAGSPVPVDSDVKNSPQKGAARPPK